MPCTHQPDIPDNRYFADGARILRSAERTRAAPSLFDLIDMERADEAGMEGEAA